MDPPNGTPIYPPSVYQSKRLQRAAQYGASPYALLRDFTLYHENLLSEIRDLESQLNYKKTYSTRFKDDIAELHDVINTLSMKRFQAHICQDCLFKTTLDVSNLATSSPQNPTPHIPK